MRQKAENERRCGRTIFLTDRVVVTPPLCKLGVPSKNSVLPRILEILRVAKLAKLNQNLWQNEHLRSVFDWIQIQFDKTEFRQKK